MKKFLISTVLLIACAGFVFSQNSENTLTQMDAAVNTLAGSIHAKLLEKRAEKVIIGNFTYQGNNTSFSSYWVNHLSNELVNISNRNYSVLQEGSTGAEWIISGEIITISDTVRIYTRLIRVQDRAIEGSFLTNFDRSETIINLLSFSGTGSSSGSGGGSGSSTDSYEPDSWDNPVTYTIGTSAQSAPVLNRTLTDGDEDFFLLIPQNNGRLTIETTGSGPDTYMYLYNYDTEEDLAENDDGGQGLNARIVYSVRAGTRYLAVVRGFSSSNTGSYGFRAYMVVREGMSSFDEPISYEIGVEGDVTSVPRTLQAGDEDYFLLIPDRDGRLTIETTGRTDTYLELFDADGEILAEDDDGGNSNNARLRYNVRAGTRYIAMVRGYNSSVTGSYNFRAFFPASSLQAQDEYEPDDEPGQAKQIIIGTPQTRTFHSGNDVDWARFDVTRAGRYIINARGVTSNRLDTYLELFDSNLNLIAEDDDSGDSLSARLSLNLNAGTYFIKVWCLSDEPDQGYILSIEAQ